MRLRLPSFPQRLLLGLLLPLSVLLAWDFTEAWATTGALAGNWPWGSPCAPWYYGSRELYLLVAGAHLAICIAGLLAPFRLPAWPAWAFMAAPFLQQMMLMAGTC